MAAKVLDSWALLAFFEDESAADAVEELLHQAVQEKHKLYLSVVNWGEIYYTTMRRGGESAAKSIATDISQMPIYIVETANIELVRQAAVFKATKKLSYADCFAAALAKIKNAELVTGDREFKQLARDVKIHWLHS